MRDDQYQEDVLPGWAQRKLASLREKLRREDADRAQLEVDLEARVQRSRVAERVRVGRLIADHAADLRRRFPLVGNTSAALLLWSLRDSLLLGELPAPLSEPGEDPPKSVRVRIPVAVDPKGSWIARGYTGQDPDGTFDEMPSLLGMGEAHYFVEATLAIPEAKTVEGAASPAEDSR